MSRSPTQPWRFQKVRRVCPWGTRKSLSFLVGPALRVCHHAIYAVIAMTGSPPNDLRASFASESKFNVSYAKWTEWPTFNVGPRRHDIDLSLSSICENILILCLSVAISHTTRFMSWTVQLLVARFCMKNKDIRLEMDETFSLRNHRRYYSFQT